jgi:O-antigen/teichoic acid export membrane protein
LVRNKTRTTKWNLFFHYSTFLYNIIIGIVLVPIYIKFIPRDLYGFWLVSGNILSWISLIDPGFAMIVQQRIAFNYGAKNLKKVGEYVTSCLFWTLIFIIPISIIGITSYFYFTSWLGVTNIFYIHDLEKAFLFALIGLVFSFISFTITGINQGLQSSLGIGIIYIFSNVSSIFITLYLLYNNYGLISLGFPFFWRGAVLLIGNLLYLTYRKVSESIRISFDWQINFEVRNLLSLNFIGKIGELGNSTFASLFLNYILGPTSVVIYRLTYLVPESAKLLLLRPTLALMPALTSLIGEGKSDEVFKIYLKLIQYMLWLSGLIFVGFICLNQSFIEIWAGPFFYGGNILNFCIVIWVLISSFNQSFMHVLYNLGHIKFSSYITFFQACLYVILLFLGIKQFGIIGAGIALLLAEVLIPFLKVPSYLKSKMNLSKFQQSQILREITNVTFSSAIILVVFFFFRPTLINNWNSFIFNIMVITFFYLTVLCLMSKSLRSNLFLIFNGLFKIKHARS